MRDLKIVIKGAGEMATGIACRLFMANLKLLVMMEIPQPITVRRTVAFSEAVYESEKEIGKDLDDAMMISDDDIVDALDGLPEFKIYCSTLGASGLQKAIIDYFDKHVVSRHSKV